MLCLFPGYDAPRRNLNIVIPHPASSWVRNLHMKQFFWAYVFKY